MSLNLSIKGVPEDIARRLRERAERNHRSLQGELMAIVEQAVIGVEPGTSAVHTAPAASTMPHGWKTIEDLLAERRARPLGLAPGLPLAVDIIRADRDNR